MIRSTDSTHPQAVSAIPTRRAFTGSRGRSMRPGRYTMHHCWGGVRVSGLRFKVENGAARDRLIDELAVLQSRAWSPPWTLQVSPAATAAPPNTAITYYAKHCS
jgi:hypothetical protein